MLARVAVVMRCGAGRGVEQYTARNAKQIGQGGVVRGVVGRGGVRSGGQ